MFFGLLARVFYPTPADILMKHMKKQKEESAGGEYQLPDTAKRSPASSLGAPKAQPINASEHWHGPGEQHDTE